MVPRVVGAGRADGGVTVVADQSRGTPLKCSPTSPSPGRRWAGGSVVSSAGRPRWSASSVAVPVGASALAAEVADLGAAPARALGPTEQQEQPEHGEQQAQGAEREDAGDRGRDVETHQVERGLVRAVGHHRRGHHPHAEQDDDPQDRHLVSSRSAPTAIVTPQLAPGHLDKAPPAGCRAAAPRPACPAGGCRCRTWATARTTGSRRRSAQAAIASRVVASHCSATA